MLGRSLFGAMLSLIAVGATGHAQILPEAPETTRAAPDRSLVALLLQNRREFALSDEQVRALDSLQRELQKTTLKQTAAVRIAELEFLELQSAPTFDAAKASAKLDEIDAARAQLRADMLSTAKRARDVLTTPQLRKLGLLAATTPTGPDTPLDRVIQQQVQAAVREQLRDQKVVEVETTQAIVDRLTGLGKLLLLIGGVPLAILSFFGVKKLTNLAAVLRLTQKQLDEAGEQVKSIRKTTDDLANQQEEIKSTADALETQYQGIREAATKAVQEISTVQRQVTAEGEKATLSIRTTAEAFKALPPKLAESTISPPPSAGWPSDGSILTIPVVVHIVYHLDEQNISDAQVASQIDALNLDFHAKNPDISKVPAPFKDFVGDARIEFALATEDPLGNKTNGITRTRTKRKEFSSDGRVTSSKQGGAKAWDADRYLNIWVCPLGGGLLSFSQSPGGSKDSDGVVINYRAFGTTGTVAAPFNKGRTATSAIATYLDLRPLWSEDCRDADLVADTPRQKSPNFGTPVFPHISCDNGPNGDMFMNFMDYVDDEARYMFTRGQVTRMHETLVGPRRHLGRSS